NNRASLTTELQDRFRPVQIDERWDGDAQMGGPIVRDRLWFFGGGERYRDAYWPTTFAAGSITANDPKYDASDRRFIGKLTAAVTPAMRLEAVVTHASHYIVNANAGPL